jgi:hypothetical protein
MQNLMFGDFLTGVFWERRRCSIFVETSQMKSVHKKSWKYDSGIIVCNVFVLQIHTASSPF